MRHGRIIVATLAAYLSPVGSAGAQQTQWHEMPRMELEAQYAGPLQDTIVQRWRDPDNGTICYIYLPITVAHTPAQDGGYVRYGANTIGSINCVPGTALQERGDRARPPKPRPEDVPKKE